MSMQYSNIKIFIKNSQFQNFLVFFMIFAADLYRFKVLSFAPLSNYLLFLSLFCGTFDPILLFYLFLSFFYGDFLFLLFLLAV